MFKVVVNDRRQYSIWRADRPIPKGWHDEGTQGTREECLTRVEQVWVDMRPATGGK